MTDTNGDADPSVEAAEKEKNEKKATEPLVPISVVFSAFGNTPKVVLYRFLGIIFSLISGCCYPAVTFYFASFFEKLAVDSMEDGFLKNVGEMFISFVVIGAIAGVSMTSQGYFLEMSAAEAATDYKLQWFNALLRQDMAYFDIKDVASQATVVSVSAAKYQKGVGGKLGAGIQFFITILGGFGFAFYASWDVALIVLAVLPLMIISAVFTFTLSTKKTERAIRDYEETGGIVYSTFSVIRTVFSLNAAEPLIEKFKASTEQACKNASILATYSGLGFGGIISSFSAAKLVLTLYGSYVIYSQVQKTGCDPTNTTSVEECSTSGTDVLLAIFGIAFGAMGFSHVTSALEALTASRAACHSALSAIHRTVEEDADYEDRDVEAPAVYAKKGDIPLPKYIIDSSSDKGSKPSTITGKISFREVSFAYPTRRDAMVFNGLSIDIEAGQTVAFVGPSGSGKSTIVSLLERFYDPIGGSITLDGTDLRDINVQWLRNNIGLVSQEPVLFGCSIKENIAYGLQGATDEQIIEVSKAANAHDFISKFADGYDTMVGEKGAQLSGGQKQRIAIARTLLKNPKILLLDEATSALDSESEYIVQQALDNLLSSNLRTTIVIAHRLSTIRNADMICVVNDKAIVETGTHDELVSIEGSVYGKLVAAQEAPKAQTQEAPLATKTSLFSSFAPAKSIESSGHLVQDKILDPQIEFRDVHFHYPSRPENPIFSGLNLKIESGETIAIVGPSGCGKSTVVQMIERFYDPLSGSIAFEGTDLKELNVKWYRDQIGFVSQEPTLFNTTIAENIQFGLPGATQVQIEEAAKMANAHDFIMGFPNGYQTEVGENSVQVSGGQKQRIAIARAILKNPKVLMLDEATSALDSASERVVQKAIDKLMETKERTTIIIAHRLSTIRNADRIAVVADGVLKEIGSHENLMSKPNGQYRRLVEFQEKAGDKFKAIVKSKNLVEKENPVDSSLDPDKAEEQEEQEEREKELAKIYGDRAKSLAKDDRGLFFIGSIGAIIAGVVYPVWGICFGLMINLFFKNYVLPCEMMLASGAHDTCQEYWDSVADKIRTESYTIAIYFSILIAATLIGNIMVEYGFDTACARMNKRVRDTLFTSLMRQDVAFYDMNSISALSNRLEEDASRIHSFSGEPIRAIVMCAASIFLGIAVSFIYNWPLALMIIVMFPFLAFGEYIEMVTMVGADEGAVAVDEEGSAGAIVIETLLSMRTVASLAMEKMRFDDYAQALKREDVGTAKAAFMSGFAMGVGFWMQFTVIGFLFWWGAWILKNYPDQFDKEGKGFENVLISLFSFVFSISGLSVALMGLSDRKEAEAAANRIFALFDSRGEIDALSDEGKKET